MEAACSRRFVLVFAAKMNAGNVIRTAKNRNNLNGGLPENILFALFINTI
jgi:hypothetical protein